MDEGFGDQYYWSQTAVQCLKEFTGVLMFLVAYSRMGMFDTFTGPLVNYVVLVVLAFPFINSYLFFLMRFGPWWVVKADWMWVGRTVVQFSLVVTAQVLGSLSAYEVVKAYEDKWTNATMITSVKMGLSKSITKSPVPELLYNTVSDDGTDETHFFFLFEEFFAVFIFLVGTLHLIEAVTPNLLQSAFWSMKSDTDPIFSGGTGFSSRYRDLHSDIQRLTLAVSRISKTLSVGSGVESTQPEEVHAYVPVPFMLIFQLSILLAGVSRTFPSAHLSPHISFYKGFVGSEVTWTCVWLRITGGVLASFAVLFYYFTWYVWVGKPTGGVAPTGTFASTLYKHVLVPDKQNALFRAEMLRLPQYMVLDQHPSGIAEDETGVERGLHLG